ncbi:hypothetical protein FOA52_004113 [Chlamydomonas sp. UWO 241]|nr:hypothetical protein FOA52_004113 [Chlamydomonas sp. UWO 241]
MKSCIRTAFQTRHVDQVWEDVRKPVGEVHVPGVMGPNGTTAGAELDEDTPGFGKHYCISCARYFQNEVSLTNHQATKPHKRKLKMLLASAKPHNARDSEKAGGLGAPDNGPKLGRGSVRGRGASASAPTAMAE